MRDDVTGTIWSKLQTINLALFGLGKYEEEHLDAIQSNPIHAKPVQAKQEQ